ncbi:MAG: helix-turn-helix domain-containing protein, partial [Candidatus Pacebacteria bacterium]|nr:helix-turn-helix domain-containing protein [Candidatus Paceibacterota bacterium]
LEEMVAQGTFRQDLYYRIHVISVSLPPLRERLEDLPILAQEFLQRFAALEQRQIEGFDAEVFKAFFSYDWPGNIRELENTVERAVVLCSSQTITLDLLPEHFDKSCKTEQRKTNVLQETRRQAIVQVLERNHYNVQSSAVELGLHRSTLYRQIKKLDIDIP